MPLTASEAAPILVVDDEVRIRALVCRALEGRSLATASTADEAREKFPSAGLVLLDLRLAGDDGMDLLREFHENRPTVPILIMTAFASIESAVEAMKRGARDYITKPFSSLDELRFTVDRALREARMEEENRELRSLLVEQDTFEDMIGGCEAMKRVYALIERFAASDSTVLITGESGTGKELVARALHRRGPRRDKPFVEINCAAIPQTLLESELFGYERGAFTGAVRRKKGLLETASGGTVFLDEIGEMPTALQAKLLRAIEEKSFMRLGGTSPTRIDPRIIAATNRDVKEAVAQGMLREDLYYRLAVIQVEIPPLREREGDLMRLIHAWLPEVSFEADALEALQSYAWPGNIRELRNVVERLKHHGTRTVRRVDLPGAFQPVDEAPAAPGSLPEKVAAFERDLIREALRACDGSRTDAARRLGISRQSLQYKLEKLDIRY